MFAQCGCTQEYALTMRVFPAGPPLIPACLVSYDRSINIIAQTVARWDLRPMTQVEFLARTPPEKRRLYREAFESLLVNPYTSRDAKAQVKCKQNEKTRNLPETMEAQKPMRPRLIIARGPRHVVHSGVYIAAAQSALMHWRGWRRNILNKTRIMVCGMDRKQWARLLMQKLSNFNSPVVIVTDASAFDASITVHHLRSVHKVLRAAFKEPMRFLDDQLKTKLRGMHGLKAKITGKRCSGDSDTSFGNSIIMASALRSIAIQIHMIKWDAMVNGDDGLLIFESSQCNIHTIQNVKNAGAGLGFNMKAHYSRDQFGQELTDIEFCSGKIIFSHDRYRFVTQPSRSIAGWMTTDKNLAGRAGLRTVYATARAHLALEPGVPILTASAERIVDLIEKETDITKLEADLSLDTQTRYALRESNLRPTNVVEKITNRARVDYAEAFNIEPNEQKILEKIYARVLLKDVDPANAVLVRPDADVSNIADSDQVWNYPEAVCHVSFRALGRIPRARNRHLIFNFVYFYVLFLISTLLGPIVPTLLYVLVRFVSTAYNKRPRRRRLRRQRYAIIAGSGTGKSFYARSAPDVLDDDQLYKHRSTGTCEKCEVHKLRPRGLQPRSPSGKWEEYLNRKWAYQRVMLNGTKQRIILVHSREQAVYLGLKIVCAFYLSDRDIVKVNSLSRKHDLATMRNQKRNVMTEGGSHARIQISFGEFARSLSLHATWLPEMADEPNEI